MEPSIDSKNNNLPNKNLGFIVAYILIFISFIPPLIASRDFTQERNILYFPIGMDYLFFLRCIPYPIAVLLLIVWAVRNKKKNPSRKFNVPISIAIILLCIGLFTQYTLIFVGQTFDHVGTVNFKDNDYHLARIHEYDERTTYILGKCDSGSSWCEFNEILYQNPLISADVAFGVNEEFIYINFNNKELYTFDGKDHICINESPIYCVRH